MAENEGTWQFWCGGMHIVQGLRQHATNGFMGIDAASTLVLYDNKGNEFDHAPIMQVEAKLKGFNGNVIRMNGNKYRLQFAPLGRTAAGSAFGLVGGLVANMMTSRGEDKRSPRQKEDEFAEVVHRLQGN